VDATTSNNSPRAESDRLEAASAGGTNLSNSATGAAPATANQATTAQFSDPASHASVTEQVSRAIVAQADVATSSGRVDFRLRLEPPELGTVNVHLTLTNQGLTAHLTVQEGAARQLIQGQLESLRQRLQEMGVGMGQLDVSGGGGGTGGQPQTPSSVSSANLSAGEASPTAQSPTTASSSASTSLIDVMV
jgi:flagellar hook-length control protein FliK